MNILLSIHTINIDLKKKKKIEFLVSFLSLFHITESRAVIYFFGFFGVPVNICDFPSFLDTHFPTFRPQCSAFTNQIFNNVLKIISHICFIA